MPDPVIYAICLALPSRTGLTIRSLRSLMRQTVSNRLQALLVSRSWEEAYDVLDHLSIRGHNMNLRPLAEPGAPPARLLQLAVSAVRRDASGSDVIVLWDDDNVSHPLRLERQLDCVGPRLPCYLSSGMWRFYDTDELFICDLEVPQQPLLTRIIPSTMMVRVEDLRDTDLLWGGRGSPTAAVGRSVQRRGNSHRLPGEFALVMVGVRGDNAQGYEYHRELVSAHAAGPCSGLWSAGRCCAGGWTITRSRPAVCGCAGLMEWLSAIPWPRRRRICPTWGSRRASTA